MPYKDDHESLRQRVANLQELHRAGKEQKRVPAIERDLAEARERHRRLEAGRRSSVGLSRTRRVGLAVALVGFGLLIALGLRTVLNLRTVTHVMKHDNVPMTYNDVLQPRPTIRAIAFASRRYRAYFVGDAGTVLEVGASSGDPRPVPTGITERLNAVAEVGDAVVVVGDKGAVFRLDGSSWVREDSTTTEDLYALAAVGDDVYAAGARGTIIRRDAATARWSRVAAGTNVNLHGIGVRGDNVRIVGDDGVILVAARLPAGLTTWKSEASPSKEHLYAVDARGLIVGAHGTILAFDESAHAWISLTSGTREDLLAIACALVAVTKRDGAFAAVAVTGRRGTILVSDTRWPSRFELAVSWTRDDILSVGPVPFGFWFGSTGAIVSGRPQLDIPLQFQFPE